ncbi:MAG: BrnT family toxin [Desulfobacterales bacterium]
MKFEWDKRKNHINIKKHGISFEEAAFVFSDIDAISVSDEYHSDFEERWITIGKIKNHGITVVIHTERIKGDVEFIRIISARKAEKYEEKEYINRLGGK